MSIRSKLICGLILSLSLLSVAVSQNSQPTTNKLVLSASLPSKGSESFSGKAIYVTLKNSSQGGIAIEDPELRKLGERSFIVGHSAAAPVGELRKSWVPVAEVWTIEEFADAKAMAKIYRVGTADAK